MPRNNQHIELSEALKMFIEEHKLQKGIDRIRVREAWKNVMGQGVNSYTTAIGLQNDVLMVSLSSSVLREELSYGKEKIISMINEALGKELVRELYLK